MHVEVEFPSGHRRVEVTQEVFRFDSQEAKKIFSEPVRESFTQYPLKLACNNPD